MAPGDCFVPRVAIPTLCIFLPAARALEGVRAHARRLFFMPARPAGFYGNGFCGRGEAADRMAKARSSLMTPCLGRGVFMRNGGGRPKMALAGFVGVGVLAGGWGAGGLAALAGVAPVEVVL